MAGSNSATNNQTIKVWFHHRWLILTLFVVFCCNASMPVGASTVGNRVDSSTEIIPDGVGLVTTDGISDMPKRPAEIVQMPHVFRHQEHYSRRIENTVNEMKRTQLHQQLSGNYSNSIAKIVDSSSNNNNKYSHFQSQLQPQMPEYLHHYNRRHYSLAPVNTWKRYNLPPLRHQRHQQQQQQQYDQENKTIAAILQIGSVVTEAPPGDVLVAKTVLPANVSEETHQHKKRHRLYDRDGLYQQPYLWTTKGPQVRADKYGSRNTNSESIRCIDRKQRNSQRLSLNLAAASDDETVEQAERYYDKTENSGPSGSNIDQPDDDSHQIAEYDMDSNDEYDDYSYEDSNEARDAATANEFPNGDEHRTAVKRYTNPFNELRLPPKKRDYPHPFSATRRRASKDRANVDDDSNAYANSDTDSEDNSDTDFSSAKWQRIEQEHHRKQQEHQRQMLALRARHDGKYRSLEAAATTATAIVPGPTTAVKQQRLSDDEYPDDEPYKDSSEQYPNRPGELTFQKYRELGTMQAVQQSRDLYLQRQKSPSDLATEHINRMKVAARCSRPLPRVFHVSNDTSKTYVPSCTILHRCGEDTGCCRSMGQVCTAKTYEDVPLHFIVIQENSSYSRRQREIEILRLRNDTECHCINRTDLTSVQEFNTRDKRSGLTVRRPMQSHFHALDSQNQLTSHKYSEETNENNPDAVCRCPKHFDVFQEDIRWQLAQQRHEIHSATMQTFNCRCDCADTTTTCHRFKNGEEGFAMDDRRCIADKICSVPNCSYGTFNEQTGRCPRPIRKHKRHNNGFG